MPAPFVQVLRENDTYDFVNPTPTRLYYCEADDQVSFRNAIVAADTLQLLGAIDTEAEDVTPDDMPEGADHGECIFPAVNASLEYFDQYAQIISDVPESLEAHASWVIRGNVLRADLSQDGVYELRVFDALGRQVVSRAYRSGEVVNLSGVVRGFAAAQVSDQTGPRIGTFAGRALGCLDDKRCTSMILSDREILLAIERGEIVIEPYDRARLGTNSYDVHLGSTLAIYDDAVLDAKRHNKITSHEIPHGRSGVVSQSPLSRRYEGVHGNPHYGSVSRREVERRAFGH